MTPTTAQMIVAVKRKAGATSELYHACLVAAVTLDKTGIDPDSDIAVLARQFLRAMEREHAPCP